MKKMHAAAALTLCFTLVLSVFSGAIGYSGSASYAGGKYYAALTALTLTGDARTDIIAIAESQVGYQEGSNSAQLSGEIRGDGNYTEYGRWYGLQDMWCAMFVSWCAHNAGVPATVVPKHSYTVSGLNQFLSWGRAYTRAQVAAGTYTPQPGDVIYFKSSRNQNKTNHVGLVTDFRNNTIYTVEGNTSSAAISTNGGAVCEKSYSVTNTFVVYVCSPDYGGEPVTPPAGTAYFRACAASCGTITEGLNSIGVDSSLANRKTIAAANGFENYSGTAEQNNQMLSLLKAGRLIDPNAAPAEDTCFPACAENCATLAEALESVGADSSYAYRKQIAAANTIENYSGTADQNNALLALLKAGALRRPADGGTPTVTYFTACDSSYTSLADALRSVGADGSFAYRAQIAAANGIADYSGTAAQNNALLAMLKTGTLIVPDSSGASGVCGCGSAYLEHITLAQTCSEDGAEYDRCTKCGAESGRIVLPATGHSYTLRQTAPTCTADGANTYTCLCGETYTQTVPASGHDFDSGIKENVTVERGIQTVRCSRCEAVETTVLYIPGDADGSGRADLRDVAVILRALAGGWDVTADETAADVNRDGVLDLKDAALLRRYLAGGWEIELL